MVEALAPRFAVRYSCRSVLVFLGSFVLVRTKNSAYFHSSFRDESKKYISPFVNDPGDYCLHSLKSGGASNDGYNLHCKCSRAER